MASERPAKEDVTLHPGPKRKVSFNDAPPDLPPSQFARVYLGYQEDLGLYPPTIVHDELDPSLHRASTIFENISAAARSRTSLAFADPVEDDAHLGFVEEVCAVFEDEEEDYDRSEFMGGDSDRPEPYERPGNDITKRRVLRTGSEFSIEVDISPQQNFYDDTDDEARLEADAETSENMMDITYEDLEFGEPMVRVRASDPFGDSREVSGTNLDSRETSGANLDSQTENYHVYYTIKPDGTREYYVPSPTEVEMDPEWIEFQADNEEDKDWSMFRDPFAKPRYEVDRYQDLPPCSPKTVLKTPVKFIVGPDSDEEDDDEEQMAIIAAQGRIETAEETEEHYERLFIHLRRFNSRESVEDLPDEAFQGFNSIEFIEGLPNESFQGFNSIEFIEGLPDESFLDTVPDHPQLIVTPTLPYIDEENEDQENMDATFHEEPKENTIESKRRTKFIPGRANTMDFLDMLPEESFLVDVGPHPQLTVSPTHFYVDPTTKDALPLQSQTQTNTSHKEHTYHNTGAHPHHHSSMYPPANSTLPQSQSHLIPSPEAYISKEAPLSPPHTPFAPESPANNPPPSPSIPLPTLDPLLLNCESTLNPPRARLLSISLTTLVPSAIPARAPTISPFIEQPLVEEKPRFYATKFQPTILAPTPMLPLGEKRIRMELLAASGERCAGCGGDGEGGGKVREE